MGGKAALIQIIGFGFILGYISTNLNTIATRAQGNMSTYAAITESHNLAVTGANIALAKLYQDTSWRGSTTLTLNGPLRGNVTYSITNGTGGRPFLRSTSTCPYPDGVLRDTVEIVFNTNSYNSFTLFAWLTNFEGNVFWCTGDTVWGRIHSNGQLHMTGTPVFMEKVTTSKGMNPKWGTNGNLAVFKKGYETGVAEIPLPTDLSPLFNASLAGGRRYPGNIDVTLNEGTSSDNDGYAIVRQGGVMIDSVVLNGGGFNGALVATGTVSVKGVLDGQLSIGSAADIYVTDNVLYENRDLTSSNDVLGLVANSDVIIKSTVPNQTDCEVDGNVFARSGMFTAEDYNMGNPRGTLRLRGSIVQYSRGAVGTFQNGQNTLKTGYYKWYRYDERLNDPNFRPPFYPGYYTKALTIASWWESVAAPRFY